MFCKRKLIMLMLVTISLFSLIPKQSLAIEEYKLLESIGDLKEGQSVAFDQYLENAYRFVLGAAGLLAVIMLTIAGVEYASAGLSETAKSGAKERATSAILGLLLALSAALILNTINPKLLNFDLEIKTPEDAGVTK